MSVVCMHAAALDKMILEVILLSRPTLGRGYFNPSVARTCFVEVFWIVLTDDKACTEKDVFLFSPCKEGGSDGRGGGGTVLQEVVVVEREKIT